MGFMQPQIDFGQWVEVEGDGTTFIPSDVLSAAEMATVLRWKDSESPWAAEKLQQAVGQYVNGGRVNSVAVREGYGYRLSAPGYMDCTDWDVYATEAEAKAAAAEDADDEDSED